MDKIAAYYGLLEDHYLWNKEASFGIRMIGQNQRRARAAKAIGDTDSENFFKESVKRRLKMMRDGSYMEPEVDPIRTIAKYDRGMSTPEAKMRRLMSQRRKPQFVDMDKTTVKKHKQKNRKDGNKLFRELREQGLDPRAMRERFR